MIRSGAMPASWVRAVIDDELYKLDEAGVRVRDVQKVWFHVDTDPDRPRAADEYEERRAAIARVAADYGIDPARITSRDAWAILRWEEARTAIREGVPPSRQALGDLLYRYDIRLPADLRRFIANVLDGSFKYPSGPRRGQKHVSWVDQMIRAAIVHRVMRWKRAYRRIKERTGRSLDPYRAALAQVSLEVAVPEDTLDKWCYPRG